MTVHAADGSGTLTLPTTDVTEGQGGLTLPFTYTAAAGGIADGAIAVTVPAEWSPPSLTPSASGYTTASTGTLTVSGQTILVSGVTLNEGGTFSITYGDTSGGGGGATAGVTVGKAYFTAEAKATAGGGLAPLSASPYATVYDPDGSGSMTVSAASDAALSAGQSGKTLSFKYTMPPGGMKGGTFTLTIPDEWPAPSRVATDPGYVPSCRGCFPISVEGRKIIMSPVSFPGGFTTTFSYGSRVHGGPGLTIPDSYGVFTFGAESKTLTGGTLEPVAVSPVITITGRDGSGTLQAGVTSVSSGASGLTVPLVFTAGAGGTGNGTLNITVPDGWSMPSTAPGDAGYTTASHGSVAVSGSVISVTGVTRTAGESRRAVCSIWAHRQAYSSLTTPRSPSRRTHPLRSRGVHRMWPAPSW